ncbi:leukocyte immunoglobulin-like receptor subfamily A member 5 isoform X4 [Desmodus rotundus]|uniref:leukocyte immunoglobulin-like receptor subfamily A member 5 isoform X4 n=1 Tax=Desmodus rotundus TaxID=9430 RepID=UPI0023813638|nr:leukocyte immunoglobulin-like receptor subfamily A member 5 isoform X4 [Desmodus rotundus]
MILTFIALLCLGVLPKPSIWADPGPIVSKGSPVTIWCQGSLQANGYILYRDRGSQPVDRKISKDSSNKTGFLIQSMSSQYAGLYRCAYSTGGSLSERSEPLFLVVTGVYREPSLSAQPGPLVSLGDTLTLQCRSEPGFDRFTLTKDEGSTHPQRLHGQHSPDFPLGPVSLTHEGRYRCYSGHNLSYVWSAPSTPLDILITAYEPQDYTVGNLIRLGVSGLILVVLGVLLFEAWHSRRRPRHAASG